MRRYRDLESLGLRLRKDRLEVLDQTKLPHVEEWLECREPQEMVTAIQRLAVRGAPLIGVAAALALAKYCCDGPRSADEVRHAARILRDARPTAVNLMNAIDRVMAAHSSDAVPTAETMWVRAYEIFDQDVALCDGMADFGEPLINDGDGILTHCNTGGLATVGIGTALGVIRRAHENGKKIHLWVDETRPLLQGARLTAWECEKLGIPYTLISDNMAAVVMRDGRVQKAFTGADRVAVNGDAANKIGTYGVAVLCKQHKIPFYIVAPSTTMDLRCATGRDIPIEERDPSEVRRDWAPAGAPVFNPAFDVTPRALITALVLDNKLWR